MTAVSWVWRELTRPRGHVRHRFYRGGRRSTGGIALLMVIASILLLTILVAEVAKGALVRVQLAAQQRDDVKAEQLALGGLGFHRLILIASKEIGKNEMFAMIAPMFGTNAQELWQALPFLDTRMMRLIFITDGSVDEDDVAEVKDNRGLSEEQIDESRESKSSLKKNFLDFDGDFRTDVIDEERRVNVAKLNATNIGDLLMLPASQQMMAMFSAQDGLQYLDAVGYTREELIANLADWTDADDTRIYQGGSEASIYQTLDSPYRPKNAAFDTPSEIRLVDGWHLDGVWERVGEQLTIYGSGRVNPNTCSQKVLTGLLVAYYNGYATELTVQPTVEAILRLRGSPVEEGGLYFVSGKHFYDSITTGNYLIPPLALKPEIAQAIASQSNTFRLTSVGEVGDARVEVNAVMDFSQDKGGRLLMWKIR